MILAAEEGDVEFFRTSSLSASSADKRHDPADHRPDRRGRHAELPGGSAAVPGAVRDAADARADRGGAQAEAGIDSQWLSVVLGDLAARLQAGENQADLMEALLRLAVVPNRGTTAQDLIDYANGNLSPSAAAAANAVVGQMTRNDVRATMWSIQDVAMMLGTTPDAAELLERDADGRQLRRRGGVHLAGRGARPPWPSPPTRSWPPSRWTSTSSSLASCLAYPTTLDRSVTDPVVSDIPALLFLGQLDNETPVTWGRSVAKGLSRSTVVEWKNQGHVAAAHDPQHCVGDIAAAFLDDPARAPDLTCAQSDEYKLKFVLEIER